ncbi:negative regulator of mitosis [Periconia macrospinosa]|uniref:Negative regulator of mitosis n=1 Tax=Periconia macrospinosa TaxID=97972 RepID=A0A2V1ECJ3_9PLEO|nr:negative regulator of mitosis [Periconia macrospinosa]
MAALHSTGVRKPAALPYLIAESILDQNCTEHDYTWETYRDEDPNSPTEEVVTTTHHVVWSRGGVVRKVFNFEIEKEPVIQALLTWFPTEQQTTASAKVAKDGLELDLQRTFLTQGTQPATDPNAPHEQVFTTKEVKSRALVVFLRSQAHVFFLSGTTHVVNLPFEVDKAFPAARGLILQRKIVTPKAIPSSPQLPSAPPNSFLTNPQSFLSQTFTQSFTHPHRHTSSLGPSRLSMGLKPGPAMPLFLEELAKSSAVANTEGLPRLYSFTDPLAELGLVVNVTTSHERDSLLTINGAGHRRLEAIDKAEEVIYVSAKNEILFDQSGNDKPLLLVITSNYKTNKFTIWSAAYMEPKPISNSRKQHAPLSVHKSRRRSSYGPTAPGTGATTPAVRGPDRLRESLGGTIKNKPQPPSFKATSQNRERLSDQAVEDALSSQLNPTFDPARQPNESRRVSSLLSRAELSTSFDKTAFQDLATQRHSLGGSFNASFGASQRSRHSLGTERLSFGGFNQSRHRASTPGSMTSRMSLGGASVDDTFDEMMDDTFDTIEDYDELDDLFAPVDSGADHDSMESLRKELIMSVVAEIPAQNFLKAGRFALNDPTAESQSSSKVFTLTAPFNSATLHERKLFLYIVHSSLEHPLECELSITRKRLSPSASTTQSIMQTAAPRYACAPKFVQIQELKDARDAVKIKDGHTERVACLISANPSEPCISISAAWGTHLPTNFALGTARLFNPYAVLQDEQSRVDAGLKRTVNVQNPLLQVLCPGPTGTFEVVDGKSHRHSHQIRLLPKSDRVAALFRVLSLILPDYAGDFLLEIWWNMRKLLPTEQQQGLKGDWTAFVATLFTMAVPFVDERSKKTGRKSKVSQGRGMERSQHDADEDAENPAWRIMCSRQLSHSHAKIWENNAWQWVQQARPAADMMSPLSKRTQKHQSPCIGQQIAGKQSMLISCAELARQFNQSPIGKAASDHWRRLSPSEKQDLRISTLSEIVVILHLYREDLKLDVLANDYTRAEAGNLAPVLAQIGHWLRWDGWGRRQGAYYDLDGGSSEQWIYEDTSFLPSVRLHPQPWDNPPSILEWLSTVSGVHTYTPFPTLATLIRKSKASPHSSVNIDEIVSAVTPRTVALQWYFRDVDYTLNPRKAVELIEKVGITTQILATLPEAAQAPLMEFITRCQANPPATWSSSLLRLVQREDLDLTLTSGHDATQDTHQSHGHVSTNYQPSLHAPGPTRDIHTICQSAERTETLASTAESDRHTITRLIFREDRRFMEAYILVEPTKPSLAYYEHDSRAEDAAILEGQKVLVQWVMIRTFSLPIGSSMLKFSSKKPLLTEKFNLIGFSTSCVMKPMGNVVTADRTTYSEEKFFWAFFNQGVSAGLSISRDAQGIDTSWIMYNKPADLSNRHAGLLLGLGLNGHLKNIAKWLSFKYLTPKHTMTSVGLLLGLSASYMGTMDTLVTRLLSVHVTRMLPPGAAELNLSPYTQTTGLMGIGLLYYNTQHRRMSEVMISEIEHVDAPDPSEPPDTLRDEAYRLAAGFALGFINLGKGKDLRGLHDMRIVERLLGIAMGPKSVDIIHILDQATAGAVIAIALIFMKTHDEAVARKIDIPDTLPQFDYVRPDICLIRTLAKHMIMWDNIVANDEWITKNLPLEYRSNHDLRGITKLRSEQMPFFNVLSGLLWSISLKYAGTGNTQVRDFLIRYLDQLIRINKLPAHRYDAKLARNTVRNCQDLVALSAATVMAGTGDIDIFRRLRGLHGRIGQDVPYGSHLAAHMAIGVLFIGGGTYTFNTSNKAIASLICAFYPLFPLDVQDSRAHLQAFRHFWVLAAEPRALIVRDADTGKAFSTPITVYMRDNADTNSSSSPTPSTTSGDEPKRHMTAPCLLPDLSTISRIETSDPTYWPTTLDFVVNPLHLQRFRHTQTLTVRRRSPHDQHGTTFSATLVALNDAQSSRSARLMWDWLFTLPALTQFEKANVGLVLPTDPYSSTFLDDGATVVDHRLVLARLSRSWKARDLWVLRGVFEWAGSVVARGDGRVRWLGREVLERLRAGVLERGRVVGKDGG